MRYVSKFVLCFTSYGSYKGFKQQALVLLSINQYKKFWNA